MGAVGMLAFVAWVPSHLVWWLVALASQMECFELHYFVVGRVPVVRA
jgi:hypothetical protein